MGCEESRPSSSPKPDDIFYYTLGAYYHFGSDDEI